MRFTLLLLTALVLAARGDAKTAGVFYSTLYAYDPAYRITRITDFGVGADLKKKLFGNVDGDASGRDDAIAVYCSALNASQNVWRVEAALSDGSDFINPSTWLSWTNAVGDEEAMTGDVDGDGDEDLVFFRNTGATWHVALSTGSRFARPVLWNVGNGAGSNNQFLEDIDGDGKDDAVISWTTWNGGDWRCGLSTGSGFGAFGLLEQGFGNGMTHFVCDLDSDDKADLIAFDPAGGTWNISINGDPTNAMDTGYPIDFSVDGATASYVHPQRSDPFSGIRYYLELTDDLVSNVWTTNGYLVAGARADAYTNGLDAATNRISTEGNDRLFIRLKIEQE